MSQRLVFLESKLNSFFNNTVVALFVICIISLIIKVLLFPTNIPLILDSLEYFFYASDVSILGHLPNGYGFANNVWPVFLSFFFSLFHSDNVFAYMNLQREVTVSLSVLTIIPVYLLCRRFFEKTLSIFGAALFAFEPRIIINSLLGITEPLYIFLVAIALVLFFSPNRKWNYISFGIVGLSTIIRSEGLFLFFPLFVIFLIRIRKDGRIILKGIITASIFILILLPIAELRIKLEGTDALSGRILEGTHIVLTKSHSVGLSTFVIQSLKNIVELTGWSLIPVFIIFVPIGIFLIFKNRSLNNLSIITIMASMFLPVLYAFSSNPDTKYIYPLYPLFCVVSIITIKRVHTRIKNYNIFLVLVIAVVLLSSSIYLDYKKMDNEHQREAFSITQYIVTRANGTNDFYPEDSYIVPAELPDKWPVLKSSIVFKTTIIPTKGFDSLTKFIESSEKKGLTHLAVDGQKNRPSFLNDVFYHPEKYPYLVEIYDSSESGFKYHVKIFKIDYSLFNSTVSTAYHA